jgi:ribosomal-protein-alanine N-acetyltransferase
MTSQRTGWEVARMGPEDLPEVLAIEAESFPVPWTEQMFQAELGHAFACCRVIRDRGAVVAYAVFWITADELNLHLIATAPTRRGEGLGRALMDAMHVEGQARGAALALLEVRVGNASAIALYEACGYAVIGRRRGYYQDNGEDALVMSRQLAPDTRGSP